jgi:hypothetical protein
MGAGFPMTAGGASEAAGAFFATAFFAVVFLAATFFAATFFTAFFAAFFAGAFLAAVLRAGFALLSAEGISKSSSVVFLLIRESVGEIGCAVLS